MDLTISVIVPPLTPTLIQPRVYLMNTTGTLWGWPLTGYCCLITTPKRLLALMEVQPQLRWWIVVLFMISIIVGGTVTNRIATTTTVYPYVYYLNSSPTLQIVGMNSCIIIIILPNSYHIDRLRYGWFPYIWSI